MTSSNITAFVFCLAVLAVVGCGPARDSSSFTQPAAVVLLVDSRHPGGGVTTVQAVDIEGQTCYVATRESVAAIALSCPPASSPVMSPSPVVSMAPPIPSNAPTPED